MRRPIQLLSACALLTACAQVADLGGGPKDTEPPRLVTSIPEQGSTGFQGDRVLLEFDERIQLDRVRDRLLVSPPLSKPPRVRPVGPRAVEIELDGPLAPDRTYTFSIGEAVKDLTEGNQAIGLDLVFSTGDRLDSLVIAGTVQQAFSGEPEKGTLVMAYEATDDTSFRSGRPLYATRTDEAGRYVLHHLRAGSYTVHALKDQNTNYAFDLPNEAIAFLVTPVEAAAMDSTLTEHTLRLFAEPAKVQRVVDHRVTADGALAVTLAKRASTAQVRDITRTGGRTTWAPRWNATGDTLTLWPSDTTALREGRYELRIDGVISDTLSYRPVLRMPFHTKLQLELDDAQVKAVHRMRASRPIRTIDEQQFQLLVDSVPRPLGVRLDSSDAQILHMDMTVATGEKAILHVWPKAVSDSYGGTNDSLRFTVERPDARSTGILRITLGGPGAVGPMVLQLINGRGEVIRSQVLSDERTVNWERLVPGTHTLRCIADVNGNGRWDSGELAARRQPEVVWKNLETVNVRAGWDLKVDWELP